MTDDLAARVQQLASYPSGYVYDGCRRLGLAGATERLYPLSPGWRLAGPALTVRYGPKRGTQTASHSLYSVMAEATPGSVLVIECGVDRWLLGENLVHFALQWRLAGILVDGCVRDSAEVRTLSLPVFCRGAAVRAAGSDYELAELNVPVVCGGAQVWPGDYIFGDDDGCVVVPSGQIAAVAYQAEYQAEMEEEQARAIAARWPLEELKQVLARKQQRRSR